LSGVAGPIVKGVVEKAVEVFGGHWRLNRGINQQVLWFGDGFELLRRAI
jgi:hypothetical protein